MVPEMAGFWGEFLWPLGTAKLVHQMIRHYFGSNTAATVSILFKAFLCISVHIFVYLYQHLQTQHMVQKLEWEWVVRHNAQTSETKDHVPLHMLSQ